MVITAQPTALEFWNEPGRDRGQIVGGAPGRNW
jgi:hypothetical protein